MDHLDSESSKVPGLYLESFREKSAPATCRRYDSQVASIRVFFCLSRHLSGCLSSHRWSFSRDVRCLGARRSARCRSDDGPGAGWPNSRLCGVRAGRVDAKLPCTRDRPRRHSGRRDAWRPASRGSRLCRPDRRTIGGRRRPRRRRQPLSPRALVLAPTCSAR
jgi:hypothetical protein